MINTPTPRVLNLEEDLKELDSLDPNKRYHLRVGNITSSQGIIRFNLSPDEVRKCVNPNDINYISESRSYD